MLSKIKSYFKKDDISSWPVALHLVKKNKMHGLMGWEWSFVITIGEFDAENSKFYNLKWVHEIPDNAFLTTDSISKLKPYLKSKGSFEKIKGSINE